MMIVDSKFNIGDTVYLKTDIDQDARLVTAIKVMPNILTYELSKSTECTSHYDFEISTERNICLISK